MIKTLDQQKETRSTPNIEPRAGDTETTPTPSEEDDFEEHNTFQLRPNKNNSNRSPQRELELKQKLNNVLEKQIPKIENGRAAKNSIKEKCLIPDATATAYSLDESLKLLAESSVILCRDNCTKQKKSIAVAIEEPSTSRVAQKSSIVIKIEENCFSPAISIGSSDDGDSSSPGNESFADESSERTAKSSSVMKIKEEDPSQDKFETNLNDRIQVEDKCPLPVINKDDDDADDGKFSLPGKQASSADETKNGEASSSSTTMDESHSPDEILDRHLSKRIKIEEKYQLSSRSSGEETSSSPVIKIDDDNSQDDQIDNEEETFLKVGGQKLSQDEEHSSPAKILILKSESPVSLSSSSASSPTSAPVIKIDEDNSQDDHSDNDEETLSRVGKDSLSQDEENSSPTKNLRLKSKSPLSLSSSSASSSTSALNISEDIKSEEPDDFVVSQEGKDSSAYGIDENKFSEKKNERTSPVDHQQGNDSDRSSSPVYAIDEDKLSVKKSRRTSVESQQLKDSERASSPDEEKFSLKKSERTTSVDLQQGNDSDRSSSPVYAIDEDKFSVKESRRTSVESQQLKDSERASSPDEEKFSLKKSEQTSPVDLQQGNDSDRSSSPVYAIDEDKFSVKESRRTSSIESQQGKDSERSSSPDEDNFSLKKSERTSHAEIQHGKDADRSSSPDFAIDDDKCSVKESRRTSPVESQQGKDSNSSSSPALAIHEDKFSVKESQRASPSAVTPSDLLPVTGAADEDASADSDDGMQIDDESFKLPKTECAISATVTKIESKSGEEDVQAEKNQTVDCQNAPATKNSKIKLVAKRKKPKKLNGLHSTFDRELKELAKQKQDLLQLSVTENNHKEPNAEQQAECSRRTSRSSSTVSSTSQQLVIDHPESEQKSKQHHHLEQQQTKDQQLLFASKRRRTGSNNNDNNNCNTEPTTSKRQCVEEQKNQQDQQSSLLLQRLQAPVQNTSDLGQTLSCYKCNAQSFDNFQQLNAHHEVCKATTTSTDVPTTANTIDADASVSTIDLAPSQPTEPPKERFYRCARCSTVHQCWHFFLHMRDVHQRYLCLYCSHVFASVEKLSLHLENKHDMDQRHFAKVEEWRTLQTQEDRPRYLICCTCQATFESGSQFEDHDCAELMQPCALCGQKGAHFNGCKNGNTITDKSNCNRKKTAIAKRKRKPVKRNQILPTPIEPEKPQYHNTELPNCITETKEKLLQEQQQQQQSKLLLENNIPAPTEDAPQEEPMHRLVVPKIMLRVPKEFQKSVDAALSSTDTEDDENDELTSATESASLLTVDAVHQQQQQEKELQEPLSSQSDDTETATETASTLFEAAPMPVNALRDYVGDEDLKSTKLPHVLAEFERTKLDIARTMAELLSKRHLQKEQQRQQEEELQHQQHLQQQHQQLHQQEQQQPLQQMQQQQQQPLEQLQQQQQQQINELQQQLHLQQQEQQPLLQLKQQQLEQLLQQDGPQQQQLLPTNEAKQERRRWSLTPPASPHNNHINQETHVPREQPEEASKQHIEPAAASADLSTPASLQRRATLFSESMDLDESINVEQEPVQEQEQQPEMEAPVVAPATPPPPPPPADGIEVAGEDTHTLDLQLDRPLDKFEMVDFVRLCLKMVYPYCLYCNHARRIAVDARQLVLHLIGKHRFTATVDSITAEELHAETIVMRLKSYLPAFEGGHYMNSESCCSLDAGRFSLPFNERLYECFQCRYVTASHKELYTHNRRLHIKANIKCCMCRLNFFSFSELLCHICPGVATCNDLDLQFRCCLCERAPLPSAFRLMVHMRKQHQACDICLEDCHSQAKLSSHVWKHKLLHLCYRCGISYRNKLDISKHLFWKHGTESASCKRCLQKRWRHVYHFCIPPAQFTCEHCLLTFSKAIYLEVHKRQHLHDFRYACNEEDCEEKFVSRKLLLKHAAQHIVEVLPSAEEITKQEQASADVKLDTGDSITASERTDEQAVQLKTEILSPKRKKEDQQVNVKTPDEDKIAQSAQQTEQQTPRKRRKKNKRNKASLEDLNLIAPNLSESDSSDDSDSDAARSIGTQQDNHTTHGTLPMRASVDDLDMPRVMLSPSSESDSDEQADRDKEQPKESIDSVPKEEFKLKTENVEKEDMPNLKKEEEEVVEESQEMPDIWKNLLQHQPPSAAPKMENEAPAEVEPTEEQLRPVKMHVIISDHDYCKMRRTPPPTPPPSPTKLSPVKQAKAKRGTASSDSDSSSSGSSNSDSDSSSCSCGSNCSCSSSASSSSDDDSDNESSARKKNIERIPESNNNSNNNDKSDDYVNVTAVSEVEPRPATPVPQPAQLYNESDYDTNVSDTDEEFYDAHPQKMAREMAEKRLAENSAQHNSGGASNNYLIVENSRPSTPSLPEEAASFADKRERVSKNKKKKRERKSTCKSTSQVKVMPPMETPMSLIPQPQIPVDMGVASTPQPPLALLQQQQIQQLQQHLQQQLQQQLQHQLQLLPESPITPITHRPNYQPRMSEGSSCSDADGQLKRSKRTRRPNKFYGYTSDDENMSSVLAPPLQVGMQLIKPQPPPQLTWAKEDLPTPPKQHRNRNNHNADHQQQQLSSSSPHNNSHQHSNGSGRKRPKHIMRLATGGNAGSGRRAAKRVKQSPVVVTETTTTPLPPIPTLKIRPALLPVASADPSDTSDSSSDEDDEINVTSLMPPSLTRLQPPTLVIEAPPPPATKAFNQPIPPALLPNPDFGTLQYFKANNIRYPIRPPAGARQAREGESVYCYCRCPYDEVSEMIACDGQKCMIEWFHFECVGIMVAPQGKWFCAECRPKYSEGLYPGQMKAM